MHTKKSLALIAVVAFISAVTGAGMVLLFGGSSTPTASAPATVIATTAPATNTPPTTQPKAIQAVDASPAAELVPDSKGNANDASYRCKTGTVPVQVPVGKTVQQDGATYTLDEQRKGYDQTSVTFHVKLANNVSAPSLIVNNAGHNLYPGSYPQHLVQASLQPGGVGDWTLQTSAYTNYAYIDGGITDITVCTRSTN